MNVQPIFSEFFIINLKTTFMIRVKLNNLETYAVFSSHFLFLHGIFYYKVIISLMKESFIKLLEVKL